MQTLCSNILRLTTALSGCFKTAILEGSYSCHVWYLSKDDNFYSTDSGIYCFTSAGSEVEVKD